MPVLDHSKEMDQLDFMSYASRNVTILPLMIAVPFSFYPKFWSGDSQPWILLGLIIAIIPIVLNRKLKKGEILMGALTASCVLAFWFREGFSFYFFRFCFILGSFYMLWVVIRRIPPIQIGVVLKTTIVVWVASAVYQTLSTVFDLPVFETGRHVIGRGGVPSLTPEPSIFGGFLILSCLYIAFLKPQKYDLLFYLIAGFGIFLSGALIPLVGLLLLIYFLPVKGKVMLLAAYLAASTFNMMIGTDNMNTRLDSFYQSTSIPVNSADRNENKPLRGDPDKLTLLLEKSDFLVRVLKSPSFNLRIGHLYFVYFESFPEIITLRNNVNFETAYNQFSGNNPYIIETGSRYILPSSGTIIYHAGIFGIVLILCLFIQCWNNCSTVHRRLFKIASLAFFLVSPYSISSFFIVAYVVQKDRL